MQRAILIILSLCSTSSIALAAQPSFQWLGDLPGGEFTSQATAVSGDGLVIVGVSQTSNGQRGFRWTLSTGMQILGDSPVNGMLTGPNAISFEGTVIVGAGVLSGLSQPIRWMNGSYSTLPGLDIATGVSEDGSIIVGAAGGQAIRFSNGVSSQIGFPDGSSGATAFAVSQDGTTVVGECGNPLPEGCRWKDGNWQTLGHFGSGGDGHAFDVSADGAIVVGSSDSVGSAVPLAYRWEAGVMSEIGSLPIEGFNSIARAVSADGETIAGTYGGALGARAFVWRSECGFRDLSAVLGEDFCVDALVVGPSFVTGISDDGTTIVGYAANSGGNLEAFRVVLPRRSGNINHDEGVNGLDIAPFVAALFAESTDPGDLCACDFDENGQIDQFDIPGMVDALINYCL